MIFGNGLMPREIDDLFGLKEILNKIVGDVPGANLFAERREFFVEVAAFEVEDAVAETVVVDVGHLATNPGGEVGEIGDGTGYHKVELALDLLGTDLFGTGIGKVELADHVLHHFDFLANRINEIESCIGEHDGQGDSREATSGADIEDFGH